VIELAFDMDEPVADFVARHFPGGELGFGNCKAIGFVEDGLLIGGMVYHRYDPHAGIIEMSVAAISSRWLTPKVLHTVFAYPFELVGVQMVILEVDESNETMRSIAERYGFTGHRIPRLRGRNEAGMIYTLTDDEWKANKFAQRAARQRLKGLN